MTAERPHDHKPLHIREGREVRAACTEHFWALLLPEPKPVLVDGKRHTFRSAS